MVREMQKDFQEISKKLIEFIMAVVYEILKDWMLLEKTLVQVHINPLRSPEEFSSHLTFTIHRTECRKKSQAKD